MHHTRIISNGRLEVPDNSAQLSERTRKTRLRLLIAFNKLILERGYARLTVGAVVDTAGVGRSTFYEHFETRDDILRQSLMPFFSILADTVTAADVSEQLSDIIAHFWENRVLARVLFGGSTRPLVSRMLSDLILSRLVAISRKSHRPAPIVPLELVAASLADSQLGVIVEWCGGSGDVKPAVVAELIHGTSRAIVSAGLVFRPGRDRGDR